MVGEPSRALPDADFALGGRDFRATRVTRGSIGDVPFNVFARAISAARINLCITRRSHATVLRVVVVPAVRARVGGRGDRLEPVQRPRALVRAGLRAADRRGCGAGDRGVPRAARGPGAGRGDGPARARACARRAHLPAPRTPVARRSSEPCRCRREEGSRSCPRTTSRARSAAWWTRSARSIPSSRCVVVDDGSLDATAETRVPTARASSRCRSTSASAAQCRPAFATPRARLRARGPRRRRRPARSCRAARR